MKKSTLAAQSAASFAVLALVSTLAQSDSVNYGDIEALELDISMASEAASTAIVGQVVEAELEMDDAKAIWEIDIVNESGEVVTVEVDGNNGQILSVNTDDDTELVYSDVLSLAKAIEIVSAVENGALVEAELENEDGELIWEVESLGSSNQETTFRIDARTGEILS